MAPRALLAPFVSMPHDPEKVCIKTPLTGPEDCHEAEHNPEAMFLLGSTIIQDALRAMHMRDVNARLRKRAN